MEVAPSSAATIQEGDVLIGFGKKENFAELTKILKE